MSQAATLVAQLAAAGTPPELLASVAKELFDGERALETIDARKRKDRERHPRKSEEIHGTPQLSKEVAEEVSLDKKVSQTLPKTKPFRVSPFIPQILAAWNRMAAPHRLPQIQTIAGKRLRAVGARCGEHGLDGVLTAIGAVPKSEHWLGANGWLGNFDSLMRPEHCQRMIELAEQSAPAVDAEQVKANRLSLAELYEKMGRQDEAAELRKLAA